MSQVLTPANNPALYRCLFTLLGANMNSTSDQFFAALGNITKYIVVNIYCTNASVSLTTAAGGLWTAASQTGNNLVASSQVYTALTGNTKLLALTLASGATANLQTTQPILHLTTPQGGAATADFYCFGLDISV